MKLKGKYNSAIIYNDFIESEAQSQIINLLNSEAFKDCKIRIMWDVHGGAGCVIGFTSTIGNKIIPNLVGVDIGCGVEAINIGKIGNIDFEDFDKYIRKEIPLGFNIRKSTNYYPHFSFQYEKDLKDISELINESYSKLVLTTGSLGSGNHFIELCKDLNKNIWIVVHTGSRNPGLKVAQYYQKLAKKYCNDNNISVSSGLEYLEDELMYEYISAVNIMQTFASENRRVILENIKKYFDNVNEIEHITSVHNYIGNDNIIRKGAISAYKGQKLIIPINMKEGSIIGMGKGNDEWNNSAPHGAGRRLSRTKAKEVISLDKFKKDMSGIWSSCIDKSRLDEAPNAYKPIKEMLNGITDSVEILNIIKPIYNIKG
jgi:RNA-splicing ligase RtcB